LLLLLLLNMELNPPWYLMLFLPLWKKVNNVNLGSTRVQTYDTFCSQVFFLFHAKKRSIHIEEGSNEIPYCTKEILTCNHAFRVSSFLCGFFWFLKFVVKLGYASFKGCNNYY
jgi:hypothetical protein